MDNEIITEKTYFQSDVTPILQEVEMRKPWQKLGLSYYEIKRTTTKREADWF